MEREGDRVRERDREGQRGIEMDIYGYVGRESNRYSLHYQLALIGKIAPLLSNPSA